MHVTTIPIIPQTHKLQNNNSQHVYVCYLLYLHTSCLFLVIPIKSATDLMFNAYMHSCKGDLATYWLLYPDFDSF